MRREGTILDRKWAAIFAGTVGGLLLLAAALPASAVSGGEPVGTAAATVVVPTFIEITLNQSTIDFSSVNPGTSNSAALAGSGFPLGVNLTDNSNSKVNYTFNGSVNMSAGVPYIGIVNVSFNNNQSSEWATQLLFRQYTGLGNTTNASWSVYVNVPIPSIGTNTTRAAFFWIDVPAQQAAGNYGTGEVAIRASQYAGV